MFHDLVEKKIDELLKLLRPKVKQPEPEQWEDVTGQFRTPERNYPSAIFNDPKTVVWEPTFGDRSYLYRLRKIDGLHNGPAFIVERRKA